MKTRELSLAGLVLAAFGASFAACSAQGTTAAPEPADPSAGSPPLSSAGTYTAPAGGASSGAGAPTSSSAGSGGAAVAHGGAAGSTAGHTGTSFGGAPAAAGAATGTAGAATTGGCVAATGTTAAADLPIDDFEDGDNAILANGMRKGFWYTYNDGTAKQVPTTSTTSPFTATGAGHTPSLKSAETSGPAFMTWGAGLGVDFNNTPAQSCPYNATAYLGIKFWAKTTAPFKAMVQIPATTAKMTTADSATCVSTTMCNDHYYIAVPVTAAWTQFTITFADSTTFKQEGWGTVATFDKAHLLGLQFQVKQTVAFDISLDDLTFF